MKNRIITITDDGNVTVPSETKMSISEIANIMAVIAMMVFSLEIIIKIYFFIMEKKR